MCKLLSVAQIPQMVKIHAQAFTPGWPPTDFEIHMDKQSDAVHGVEDGGDLCGFVITRRAMDQAEILTIVVAHGHQRKGLGKRLLQAAEAYVRKKGVDIMFLEVAADNPAATIMYEKQGYHQCGKRPRYYRREIGGKVGRVDAIIYQKHLA